jgi:hypothetical protein
MTKLEQIEEILNNLSPNDQLLLIEKIAQRLRQAEKKSIRHWREFRGLGKEIWKGIDTDKYIEDLRKEWDR